MGQTRRGHTNGPGRGRTLSAHRRDRGDRLNLLFVSFLVVALAGLFAAHEADDDRATDAPLSGPRRALAIAACALLVGAFVFQLAVVNAAAIAQRPLPAWLASLAVRVIEDRAPTYGHAPFGDLDALAAGLETLGLLALYAAVRGRELDRAAGVAVALTSAVMLICGLLAPAMMSYDMYAYAATVHGGLAHAYAPVHAPFAADWHVVNFIYGVPVYPSAYGPVWNALAAGATFWIGSLAGTIAAFRAIEAVAFVVCVAALRSLRVPAVVLALFAVNPAIFMDSIAAGHNDLTAVALVLLAASIRARLPLAAIALAACAGAIKLPFLLIGPLAFASERRAPKRIAYALATLACSLALSAVFGGGPYLAAIRKTAKTYDVVGHGSTDILRITLVVVVVATIALTIVRRRFSPTLAWALSALGVTFSSWYLIWGVPYALAERRWSAIFLISLPGLAYLFTSTFAATDLSVRTFYFSAGLAPALIVVTLIRLRRRRLAAAT